MTVKYTAEKVPLKIKLIYWYGNKFFLSLLAFILWTKLTERYPLTRGNIGRKGFNSNVEYITRFFISKIMSVFGSSSIVLLRCEFD